MTDATTPAAQATGVRPARVAALDGARGVAIVLVVLYHSNAILPSTYRGELGSMVALFNAGSIAVTFFFVTGGYLVTRRMLTAAVHRPIWGPLLYLEQRTVRIALQVYVLLITILVVYAADSTDTATHSSTTQSLWAAATFRFNTYVRDHALSARSDFGPIYYLSIDLQICVVIMIVIMLVGRYRKALIALAAIALTVSLWWRWQFFLDNGWYRATLTTTARSEGPIAGVLAAALMTFPRVQAWARSQAAALTGSAAGLSFGLVVSCAFTGIDGYFKVQGAVAALVFPLLVVGLTVNADSGLAQRVLACPALARLGKWSLTIFIWHLPVFVFVRRHTVDFNPAARAVAGLVLLVVVTVVIERVIVPVLEDVTARIFTRQWRKPASR